MPTITAKPTLPETPIPISTSHPTAVIPLGTPVSSWHKLPIIPGAIAAEEEAEGRFYHYIIEMDQDDVRDFYVNQLPQYGWDIDWISPNDEGGYILYRQGIFDFIYVFEQGDLTHVQIFLSTGSPSLDQ